MGGRRLRFTDAERRRLARKAQALGRKVLNELQTLVTPDTLLRWYRELVASKWNYSYRRGPRRPRVMKTIVDLILRMALENPSWGYTRIRGALTNLGHQVGRGTIANILRDNGIEPAPERDAPTRSVHVAGITPHPDNSWMTQIARNITDVDDGFLRGKRYLVLDRDAKYSDGFRNVLVREGIHVVRLPPRSSNLNAFAERFVRSIK
jgi:putative transposase